MAATSQPPFTYATPGQITAAAAVLPAVSIVVVGLRLYVRTKQKAHVGADDWFNIIALVSPLLLGTCKMSILTTFVVSSSLLEWESR